MNITYYFRINMMKTNNQKLKNPLFLCFYFTHFFTTKFLESFVGFLLLLSVCQDSKHLTISTTTTNFQNVT